MKLNILKKDVNMLSGPIIPGILTIALPIMVMNVLQSLFNTIDMTILSMFNPTTLPDAPTPVGAVGICGTLISLITGLLIGISSGANVVIAKHIGRGDKDRVEKAIGSSLLIALAGGIILLIVGVLFADVFLRWNNCKENLLPMASLYFRLYFVGVPILMIYNFCAAILRSSGDSKRPMLYLTLGGVVKVILTYAFVAFFGMDVDGVAIATIISWALSAALTFIALLRNEGMTRINPKKLRFYKDEVKEILFIGLPVGIQNALWAVANVVISATVNDIGNDATTGVSIANTYDGILYQISTAPGIAVMPYVSQNIGAGNVKRAEKSVLCGMLITVILGGGFGALSAIFSGPLSALMSTSPTVIAYSQQKMVIISSTYFICGIYHIMGSALSGMRRPMVPTVATFLFMCVLRFVWVYAVYPFVPNLTFLYLVWPIGWILSIAMELCFYFPTLKKLRHIHTHAEHGADKPAI